MPQKKCSFCGRTENEVRLLITGLTGYICEDCAQQAYNIVVESGVLGKQTPELKDIDMEKVPKPTEIKAYLDEYIIGQDEAKTLSCCVGIQSLQTVTAVERRRWCRSRKK